MTAHPSFLIRPGGPADAAAVQAVRVESISTLGARAYTSDQVALWRHRCTPERYLETLARGERFFLAVTTDERSEVLGFSAYRVEGGLHRIATYVAARCARSGLGTALYRAAEDVARGCGAPDIHVDSSLGAVEFYLRVGFVDLGRGAHRFGVAGEVPCVLMRKTLVSDPFLRATPVLDHDHPAVRDRARRLAAGAASPAELARGAFEWVRDAVVHTGDAGRGEVTCAASEVLAAGTGYCYAKSHLLVALLRASGLRAGLCYQRLATGDGTYALHGLAAVDLPGHGWYRVDPRGNRPGIDASFSPPAERLAFAARTAGEWDDPRPHPDPLPLIVEALRGAPDAAALAGGFPDLAAPPP